MRSDSETVQILTGVAALILLAAALVISYVGAPVTDGGYRLYVHFHNISGLTTGSPVRLAGIRVGGVASQRYDMKNQQAIVTLEMDPGVRIPTDSAAMIISDGILGAKYVRIQPGGEDQYMKDGDTFHFWQNAVVLEDVLQRLIRAVEAKREREKNQKQDGTRGG